MLAEWCFFLILSSIDSALLGFVESPDKFKTKEQTIGTLQPHAYQVDQGKIGEFELRTHRLNVQFP